MKYERIIIAALSVLGAFRVFFFSATFPLFNNVDEDEHFGVVYEYSYGRLPHKELGPYDREVIKTVFLYGTQEYMQKPDPCEVQAGPLCKQPVAGDASKIDKIVSYASERVVNYQLGSFPTYYIIAGLWCALGRWLGIEGGNLAYWVRFLNVPLFAVLIWFSYLFARTFFGNSQVKRIGLPLLVAFFPADIFYSINSDVIAPLFFAVSFFMLTQLHFYNKSRFYYVLTGLFIAATFLIKSTNIAILALLVLTFILKFRMLQRERNLSQHTPELVLLMVAAMVPIILWLTRNYIVFGDISGSREKTEYMCWTTKPLTQIFNHPIFSIKGFLYFTSELIKTFWRGEFMWHFKEIASKNMDRFYIFSTWLFAFVSFISLFNSFIRRKADKNQKFVLSIGFLVIVISIIFLAFLSMLYDYHDCMYPSREFPYFTWARLMGGVLLPFLAIYIDGLEQILYKFKIKLSPLIILTAIVIIITYSELALSADFFANPYNWFHLNW